VREQFSFQFSVFSFQAEDGALKGRRYSFSLLVGRTGPSRHRQKSLCQGSFEGQSKSTGQGFHRRGTEDAEKETFSVMHLWRS